MFWFVYSEILRLCCVVVCLSLGLKLRLLVCRFVGFAEFVRSVTCLVLCLVKSVLCISSYIFFEYVGGG